MVWIRDMAINIRDQHFEQQVARHAKARGHRTLTKTLVQLASERMLEIELSDGHGGNSSRSVGDVNGSSMEPTRNCTQPSAA